MAFGPAVQADDGVVLGGHGEGAADPTFMATAFGVNPTNNNGNVSASVFAPASTMVPRPSPQSAVDADVDAAAGLPSFSATASALGNAAVIPAVPGRAEVAARSLQAATSAAAVGDGEDNVSMDAGTGASPSVVRVGGVRSSAAAAATAASSGQSNEPSHAIALSLAAGSGGSGDAVAKSPSSTAPARSPTPVAGLLQVLPKPKHPLEGDEELAAVAAAAVLEQETKAADSDSGEGAAAAGASQDWKWGIRQRPAPNGTFYQDLSTGLASATFGITSCVAGWGAVVWGFGV